MNKDTKAFLEKLSTGTLYDLYFMLLQEALKYPSQKRLQYASTILYIIEHRGIV